MAAEHTQEAQRDLAKYKQRAIISKRWKQYGIEANKREAVRRRAKDIRDRLCTSDPEGAGYEALQGLYIKAIENDKKQGERCMEALKYVREAMDTLKEMEQSLI